MMKIALFFIGTFITFALQFAYMIVPASKILKRRFLFSDQLISDQAYYDYLGKNFSYVVICITIALISQKLRMPSIFVGILAFGYVIDYLLTYNNPFMRIIILNKSFPCSYAMVLAIIFSVSMITSIIFWIIEFFTK